MAYLSQLQLIWFFFSLSFFFLPLAETSTKNAPQVRGVWEFKWESHFENNTYLSRDLHTLCSCPLTSWTHIFSSQWWSLCPAKEWELWRRNGGKECPHIFLYKWNKTRGVQKTKRVSPKKSGIWTCSQQALTCSTPFPFLFIYYPKNRVSQGFFLD